MRPGVVLLSGGLDSAVTLALAVRECDAHALTLRYGQRHAIEIECAAAIARSLGAREHRIIDLDLASFGGSALTGDGIVPKDRDPAVATGSIPPTYVPARNTILLSIALAWAETLGAEAIYIGAHAQDAGGYPDARPEFIDAFDRLARVATRAGIEGRGAEIRAPLLGMGKGEIVRLGRALGVDFSLTSSCYDPDADGKACGRCDACLLRAEGFREAGFEDPRTGSYL